MAQHDYVIANGTGAAVRSDLNGSLAAIVSNNSGATEPGTMYAYQWWADTTTGLLKQRNAANNAWITIGTLASANLGLLSLAGGTMTGVLAVTAGTAALPGIAVSGDLNTGLFSPGADTLALVTGGTNRVHVTSGGLVGIGNSSPTQLLDIRSATSGGAPATSGTTQNGLLRISQTSVGGVLDIGVNADNYSWIQATNRSDLSYEYSLLLNPNGGNVGIGVTGPQEICEIAKTSAGASTVGLLLSNFSTNANTAIGISFSPNLSGTARAASIYGVNETASQNATALTFYTNLNGGNQTEKARIDSSGNLLVGTTTVPSPGGVTSQTFIASNSSNSGTWTGTFQSTGASNNRGVVVSYSGATPNDGFNEAFFFTDATAVRFSVKSNGGINNYSANNANLSDINTKKDISLAADTWECIKEWEIVNYRYKDQPDDADLNLGVIAQQVAESCPEVITIFQEAKEATEDAPAQEERLGVKEQQMYWMAIKALQEAMERIEQLETEMAAVKAQLM